MVKFYGYDKCSTCRNAKKWLDAQGVAYKDIDITATPPTKALLKSILKVGDYSLKDLFNKSGQLYRQMNMKDKLPDMSEAEAISLLAEHGKLCKRPIVTDGKSHTVGFREERFSEVWG